MVDEPITLKMRLWNYEDVELKLMDLLARLIDPQDESKTLIYGNVDNGHPHNLEMFNGIFGKVVIQNKSDKDDVGNRNAEKKGIVITYVPGKDGEASSYCKRICDIVEAFLENLADGTILRNLGINGCTIKPNPNNTQNWLPVNVDPLGKDPHWCITGVTGFIVTKTKEAAIEMTI